METMNIISGDLITCIFTGMAAVISAIGGLLWGKHGVARKLAEQEDQLRTKIADELRAKITNDPLHTQAVGPFVSVGECKQHRCALEKRVDEFGGALNRIFKKLNENDTRAEDRANLLHRRLDPIVEKVAANSAQLEMLKGSK